MEGTCGVWTNELSKTEACGLLSVPVNEALLGWAGGRIFGALPASATAWPLPPATGNPCGAAPCGGESLTPAAYGLGCGVVQHPL